MEVVVGDNTRDTNWMQTPVQREYVTYTKLLKKENGKTIQRTDHVARYSI